MPLLSDIPCSDTTSSSIFDLSRRWWKKVLEKVNKAVVFVDLATADSINWFCSENPDDLNAFFKAGATNVKELSSFEVIQVISRLDSISIHLIGQNAFSIRFQSGSPDERKCVFLISSPLVDETIDAIRTTVQASSFEYCVLVTPFSAGLHTFAKASRNSPPRDDEEAFYFLEDCLLQWMGNMVGFEG